MICGSVAPVAPDAKFPNKTLVPFPLIFSGGNNKGLRRGESFIRGKCVVIDGIDGVAGDEKSKAARSQPARAGVSRAPYGSRKPYGSAEHHPAGEGAPQRGSCGGCYTLRGRWGNRAGCSLRRLCGAARAYWRQVEARATCLDRFREPKGAAVERQTGQPITLSIH